MKILLQWLGVIVVLTLVVAVLIALTMMWHPTWMSNESEPLNKQATIFFHMLATFVGICLGPMLFIKRISRQLNGLQKATYVIGFSLSLGTIILRFL